MHIMNKLYSIAVVLVLLFIALGCNNSYYKSVVKNSYKYDLDPALSYYFIFERVSEEGYYYVLPVHEVSFGKEFSYGDSKQFWKSLNKSNGKVSLNDNDCYCNLIDYRISYSDQVKKLDSMSTDSILSLYFEKDLRLKIERLSLTEQNEIIFVLISRGEFLSLYLPGNNGTRYVHNVFFGMFYEKDIMKSIDKIEKQLGREI